MKKTGILNAHLSHIIASMGHTDKLVICDAGLPIPHQAEVVDLALAPNIPRFLDTLRIILTELHVEQAIVAQEMISVSNGLYKDVLPLLGGVPVTQVSHENFKEILRNNGNIAFVRTGEITPYANIILVSGVIFS
jgi:D-ribose pyranase